MDIKTFYLQDTNPNKPKTILRNNLPTKRFKEYNLQLIKDGKVNTWIDENSIVNPYNKYQIIRKQFDRRYKKKTVSKAFSNKFPTTGGIVRLNNTNSGTILQSNSAKQFKDILKNFSGDTRIVLRKGKKIIKDNTFNITTPFNRWFKENGDIFIKGDSGNMNWFWSSTDIDYFITQEKKITKKNIKQFFRDGGDYYCFYSVIIDYLEDKLSKAKTKGSKENYQSKLNYINGKNLKNGSRKYGLLDTYKGSLPEDENVISEICNKLNIGIDIEQPFMDKPYISVRPNNSNNTRVVFRYINSRLNHLEHHEINTPFNSLYSNNYKNKIYLSRDELYEKLKELKRNDKFFIFGKDSTGVNKIRTTIDFYVLKTDYYDVIDEFEKEQGFTNNMRVNMADDYNLTNFINNGTHYNGVVDFKDTKNLDVNDPNIIHDDLQKAYSQFNKYEHYSGFMGIITDSVRPLNDYKENGKIVKGLYQITNIDFGNSKLGKLNNIMNIYFDNGIYYDTELYFLEIRGVKFDVIFGIRGERFDFEFTNDMLNKKDIVSIGEKEYKIPFYSKWSGQCGMINTKKNYYMKGKKDYFENLQTNNQIKYCGNDEYRIIYDKKNVFHRKHIVGQITAYMRLNMLNHLLGMNLDKIIRVCVDGIYYYDHVHNKSDLFHHNKEKKSFNSCSAWSSYISMCCESDYTDWRCENDSREYNRIEAHIGGGGCGKTHYNLLDKGLYNVCYVPPSWKLSCSKGNEYSVNFSVVDRFSNPTNKDYIIEIDRYNNIIIDECSMINEETKQHIINNFKGRIIFCGDIGFQLPPVQGTDMNTKGCKVFEYTKCYRFKDCEKLQKMIPKIRKNINNDNMMKKVMNSFRNITYDEMKKLYTKEDLIISYRHSQIEVIDSDITYDKYKIMNTTQAYKKGEIVLEKPTIKGVEYERHNAFTIHSIQGETTDNNLFIDRTLMKSMKMVYTAISRARKYNQVYFFSSPKKN